MKSGALALFATGISGLPRFITEAAAGTQMLPMYKKNKTLVCIFQRGAMDGLMAVTPFADPALQIARPGLFMRPTAGEGGLFNLDDRYAMHPSLKSLFPYFNAKNLAVVHGVGSPNTTRSHFDAQDYMESGTPFAKGTASGWLNRAVGLLNHAPTPFSAVSVTSSLPRSLYGDVDAIAINNLQDFSDSIAAFWQDLGERQSDVTLMTMTEFGRTVAQNGTGGTDHGRASCLFVLGNDVAGGKVYSNMGSLAKENLEDNRDLPVTTDFRSVFSAVAENHLQLKTNGNLFPDWSGASLKMML